MPHEQTSEMPQITAYNITTTDEAIHSSAGPFYDPEPNPTYVLGQQAQIQVWPDATKF